MSNKITLLIDMDGVAADWYAGLLKIYKQRFPDRATVKAEDLKEFFVEAHYPKEHQPDILKITQEAGFYTNLPPIPGAIAAMKDMEKHLDFIDPFICSSPEVESEGMACHSEKAAWVDKHLGRFWTKRLILTKDKTLVRGHFLIDDKPNITGAMQPTWLQMVYDQPYNRGATNGVRFSWNDWVEFRESIRPPQSTPAIPGRRIILQP